MTTAAMPLPAGAEMPRRVLALKLPRVSKEILIQLYCWRLQRRRIDPSIDTLSRLVQSSPRTVQRHLLELVKAGLVTRVYNGGRARRCIYYVGAKAAELAREGAPTWHEKASFGPLRLGRAALARVRSYPDKIVTLNPVHSSSVERSDRDQSAGDPSTGANVAELEPSPPDETTPPHPPVGGGSGEAEPSLQRPRTQEPPGPPKGGVGGRGGTWRNLRANPRMWDRSPELWRHVWGLWRAMHQASRRRELVPDIRDAVAMAGLISQALFATKQNELEAVRFLGWGFRQHLRAKPEDPLWRLRRARSEYGFPPKSWTVPTAESLAAALTKRRENKEHELAPVDRASNGARARAILDGLK